MKNPPWWTVVDVSHGLKNIKFSFSSVKGQMYLITTSCQPIATGKLIGFLVAILDYYGCISKIRSGELSPTGD